jgi:hypothetical protein
VIAVPEVRVIDPDASTVRFPVVDVDTGAVVAVEIVVSAAAGSAISPLRIRPRAVADRRVCLRINLGFLRLIVTVVVLFGMTLLL